MMMFYKSYYLRLYFYLSCVYVFLKVKRKLDNIVEDTDDDKGMIKHLLNNCE